MNYTLRPVADWTAGILVCAFIGGNFAQGYYSATADELADMARAKVAGIAASVLPSWMVGGADTYTSGTQSGFLNTASQWIGKDEDADRKELAAFIQRAGITINPGNTAWCAAFVNAVLYANGIKGTGEVNARSFLQWGTATNKPQPGDVVVLWRGSRESWQGHVGFFKGFDSNGNVLVLGGNQDDKVSMEPYSPDRVLGFRTNKRVGV
ncbi:TIGR02594 family protein [Candidatus Thiothrix sp. Deng01]|uniref:TIGR02594 family protein n=1 Tax=Candidatus Thiothrix phosphatis TaxID=3112415 RepID=A0ABU6CVW3_9GAMM|nr:TIGR02594 family protein [Candidatus Thiothrix sp. Deng01]MEB4590528.1 TIGR02594 family protein [Candidatus Thiothrix sp. Deng01]